MTEIIVDSFAGGGGASSGIEIALGRSPDIAINHDAVALAMHAANHPATRHLISNIWAVDPVEATGGRPVGLMWASPDCKHFSKAKGARPVEKRIRDLAWVVVRWASKVRPRVIILENVEEFATWGPLGSDGRPCRRRKGRTFREFIASLEALGYRVEHRELCAADYGAPTTRTRLFLIARRDGRKIVWPAPTHARTGAGGLARWRSAAEIIDWSLPCPSIFDTAPQIMAKHSLRAIRPLAEATMARIAKGVWRYVINAAEPFIIPITHTGDVRVHAIGDPLRTLTTAHRGEHALVTPFVTKFNRGSTGHPVDEPLHTITAAHSETHPGGASPLGVDTPFLVPRYGERQGQEPRALPIDRPLPTIVPTGNGASLVAPVLVKNNHGDKQWTPPDEPVRTICTGNNHLLVSAFLAQHNYQEPGHDAREPVSTIVGKGCTQAIVSAGLLNLKGSARRQSPPDRPAPAITAQGKHLAEVRAFLIKYYGEGGQWQDCREPLHTVTAKDRVGIVTIHGEPWQIVDIGMRMLTLRERFNAQSFAPDYRIDIAVPGKTPGTMKPISGDQGGRMVGNSVCPVLAAALAGANVPELALAHAGAVA